MTIAPAGMIADGVTVPEVLWRGTRPENRKVSAAPPPPDRLRHLIAVVHLTLASDHAATARVFLKALADGRAPLAPHAN